MTKINSNVTLFLDSFSSQGSTQYVILLYISPTLVHKAGETDDSEVLRGGVRDGSELLDA